MQTHIKMFLLISTSLVITSCTPQMVQYYWNNGPSNSAYYKKEKEYYNKEGSEQKELRDQNNTFCLQLSKTPKNRIPREGYPNGVWNQNLYKTCMTERGSPLFD